MRRTACLFISIICWYCSQAQTIRIDSTSVASSFRGMAVVSDNELWISGSKGYVGHSVDTGHTWQFQQIPSFETAELRDIEVCDNGNILVMSSTAPAAIIRSKDNGKTWQTVYRQDSAIYFLDAFDFNGKHGICIGDPINSSFLVLTTKDHGDTWHESTTKIKVDSIAAFAASGTTVQYVTEKDIVFGTGGKNALLFYSTNGGKRWKYSETAIIDGKESAGIFSIAVVDEQNILLAGGNYLEPSSTAGNFTTAYRFKHKWVCWTSPISYLYWGGSGYYSCVGAGTFNGKSYTVVCGTQGVDINQHNDAVAWNTLSNTGFNVLQISPSGKYVFLAGNKVAGCITW